MFSIIMPVWNRAEFIRAAIESVLAQTFRSYELLIMDDGSEDDLVEAVKPYLGENVILHRLPHSGACAARNAGLRLARYPFIAYLDTDNLWRPEYLAAMSEALSRGAPRQAAYAMMAYWMPDPATGALRHDRDLGRPFDFRELLAGNYIDINMFVHARRCVEHTGFFDERLRRLEDWDFILRVTSLYEPVFVPKVLVDYHCGVAKNAISLTESLPAADKIVRAKHAHFKDPVTLVHDAIFYKWDHLPPEKYHNWLRITHAELNTEDWTAWGYPVMLQIEPSSRCNLACPLCPAGRNELGRPSQDMPLSLFKSIVDDMERYLLLLVLWDWGEPLMNPQLPEMVRYASQRGIKTVTSTNAHFLSDEKYVEAILRSGLTTLIVAVDSLDDDRYRMYRQRGSLDRVILGLQKVVEIKRRVQSSTIINMRAVVMRQNEHELGALRRFARQIGVDCFTAKTLNPSCGDDAKDGELVPEKTCYRRYVYKPGSFERVRVPTICRRVWDMSNIASNGDVVPCCYDYSGTMKMGNVAEQPYTAIWNDAPYRELRQRIHQDMQAYPLCRNCGINFQLSRTGWFIEPAGFAVHGTEGFVSRWRRRLRPPLARRVFHAARRRFLSGRT